MNYTDVLIEALLEESAKTDFIEKFGEDTFDKFEKAKQRIKNSGKSVDYQQYLAMSKEELIDFIASFYDDVKDAQKKRIIKGVDKEIRGKYKYLGEKDGYKVYQPLDVQASMDLGVNTGWCTTGRYGHYGHPEYTPSIGDAKEHWGRYSWLGVRFFYFLNPDTMYGEYALALYPRTFTINREFNTEYDKVTDSFYLSSTNFELFNAEDNLDYSAVTKLPLDLIPETVRVNLVRADENGLIIGNKGSLIGLSKGSLAKSIVIPDHVVSIGANAFRGNPRIESIVIPKGVKSIGAGAFLNCTNLTSITFEEGSKLTKIGKEAFYNCTSLNSINLPARLKNIGESAFQYCIKLTSLDIPDDVTDLNACVLWDCRNLTSITLPKNLLRIGPSAFRDCSSLTSLILPDGLEVIGWVAFYGCTGLKSVTLPRSLTDLAYVAFMDNNIEEVNYLGTLADWEALTKTGEFYLQGTKRIKLLDGYIDCETGEIVTD